MTRGLFHFILFLSIVSTKMVFSQSKTVWLVKADEYYEKENYASALRLYNKALDDTMALKLRVLPYEVEVSNQKFAPPKQKRDSTKTVSPMNYLKHQIAMCYRKSQDYQSATEYFKISASNNDYPDDYYYLGNSLMYTGEYDEAIKNFEHLMSLDNVQDETLEMALQDMSSCSYAKKQKRVKEKTYVNLADTSIFNKGITSFAANYWGDNKLIFSSARPGGVIIDPNKQDSRYLSDLYYTEKEENGKWGVAKNFGRPLNSGRHEASGMFNNGNTIYYTKWSAIDGREKSIYLAKMIQLKFFESQKLGTNVNWPESQSINPFVTSDNKWLYFSSDRPGGLGGMDIYRIELDEEGKPKGDAINLGKPINSEFDERAPFFHEVSNTLFFSSDGHESLGGLDIFKSRYNADVEAFGLPQNMGEPINSSYDDTYYITDEKLKYGFISSNRNECTTCDSTYNLCSHCYKLYEIEQPDLDFKISGYVYDVATNEVIPGATIEFKDVSYQWEHFEVIADENGYYEHELIPNLQLFMRASKSDYFADKAVVITEGETSSRSFTQDFFLEKIPEGEITIEGIEYDFDKATLRPKSIVILNKLLEFLELNRNLTVEIRSHTDERGSADYNKRLSQARAQSVVDYLIKNGIPMEKLKPKGYGEEMPAQVPDLNGKMVTLTPEYIYSLESDSLQEEYHQRNRRTAFFVLKQE